MKKIVVIEDEANVLRLYQRELIEEGYQVVGITDGTKALETIEEEQPHLVVLDVKLNKLDGLQLLREIKAHNRTLPVVLNTAYGTYKGDFKSWLADAYIIKSSDLRELKETIGQLLVGDQMGDREGSALDA